MFDLLKRNRDLRLVFSAQVVSFLGDWFADVALLGLVLDLTDSPSAAGLVMVSSMLPVFLVAPFAGPAVDTFDRRALVVAVSLAQAAAALALLAVGASTVWLAFVARAAISALGAFVAPAAQAAIPNLVDADDLPMANALLGSVWGAMLAIGAAVGGAFTVAFGRDASFLANATTFLVAASFMFMVRRPMSAPRDADAPHRRMRPIADMTAAFHFARGHRPVKLLLFSKTGLGLAGGVVPLLAVYGKDVFDAGDGGIGLLLAARGVGALAGPLIARRRFADGVAQILFACGVAGLFYAVGYGIVAASPVLLVALAGALIAHLGGGAQWTMSNIGLQMEVPDALRGRIFATDFALVTLTMSTSFVLAGWGSDHFGPRPVTVVLAAIAGGWSVVYLGLTRTLRRPPAAATSESRFPS